MRETGFDQQQTIYHYDDNSGVLAHVDDNGIRTSLLFDPMGRLTERSAGPLTALDEHGVALNAITESFAYDASGRLILADNADSQLQWYYDDVGNLTREHQHYRLRGSAFTSIWRHDYDVLDNRVTTIRPDGHRIDWLTYGSGHVHGLMLDGQEQAGFERDDLHREIRRTLGTTDRGHLAESRQYDPAGRLTEQLLQRVNTLSQTSRTQTSNSTLIQRNYQYDAGGQLVGIADSRRGTLGYQYDPVGRLLAASSRLGQETFAFDPAGNLLDPATADQRQYHTREKAELPQFTSQLTGTNKLMDNLLRNYAGKHFEYDERGNLRARIDNGRTQRFEWDHFNRLAAVRSNEVDTEFAYDPLGRRLLKHSTPKLPVSASAQAAANPAWLASETARLSRERGYGVTLYGWDGDQIAWEGDAETTTHYVFEPGSFVPLMLAKAKQRIALIPTPDWSERDYDIDADPLWTYSPEPQPFEQLYFYHTDHLGTPQELTDMEGNLAWSADYKAWGEAKAVISEAAKRAGIDNPLRFQGQYFDHETGLHYNRHRYYDPSVGRFISKDPIGLMGGLNIFAYAANPVEWVDPWGLSNKPANSPTPGRWVEKGGTVWQEMGDKTWVYQDRDGNVVRYPNGYPDFNEYERQKVDVPNLRGDHSKSGPGDFGRADKLAPKGAADYDNNTWHHHENGVTMQELPKTIHDRFTHCGGVSKIKKGT